MVKIKLWRWLLMFENIFETVVKGSNTIFLDIPEEDYFFSYDTLSPKSAQELTNNYFKTKAKDGVPKVTDVDFDSSTHRVKILLEVDYNRDYKLEQYNIPDALNVNRNHPLLKNQ
jgi:hypothetical protein